MRRIAKVLGSLAMVAAMAQGCAYAGVAAVDSDTVVIAKNNGFLFGLLNQVYVCQVTDGGLTACSNGEAP